MYKIFLLSLAFFLVAVDVISIIVAYIIKINILKQDKCELSFKQNIIRTLKKISMKGRGNRIEYVDFFIFQNIIQIIGIALTTYVINLMMSNSVNTIVVLSSLILMIPVLLISIWSMIANFCLLARRLHDFNWSFGAYLGLLLLISCIETFVRFFILHAQKSLIPNCITFVLITLVYLFVMLKKGTEDVNKYGEPQFLTSELTEHR